MENIVLTNREYEELMNELLPIVARVMQDEFKQAIALSGRVMSKELMNRFDDDMRKEIGDFVGWVQASFGMYGRFQDMNYVQYKGFQRPNVKGKKYSNVPYSEAGMPDIVQGFLRFIRERRLIDDSSVPGYNENSKRMPIKSRAEVRLAWAMVAGRMMNGRVKRRKGGNWYHSAVVKIKKTLAPIAANKVAIYVAKGMASAIGD